MALIQHRQRIDTECSNSDARVLNIKAIKLDGDKSLKESLGLAGIKTCDYFRCKKGKAVFIECTDLIRQLSNEQPGYRQIAGLINGITDPSQKKSLHKAIKPIDPETRIREELRYKCIHSLFLLHRLGERTGFKVDEKFSKGVIFLVAICSRSPADVLAFQHLETKLQAALKGIVDGVSVLPADSLPISLSK